MGTCDKKTTESILDYFYENVRNIPEVPSSGLHSQILRLTCGGLGRYVMVLCIRQSHHWFD